MKIDASKFFHKNDPQWIQDALRPIFQFASERDFRSASGACAFMPLNEDSVKDWGIPWLHILFPGQRVEFFNEIEFESNASEVISPGPKANVISLDRDHAEFLTVCNGAYLFSGHLMLHGFPREDLRDMAEKSYFLPSPITDANFFGRRSKLFGSECTIGCYPFSSIDICSDARTNEVFLVDYPNGPRRKVWGSFSEFLTTEIMRIGGLFDENRMRFGDPHQIKPGR